MRWPKSVVSPSRVEALGSPNGSLRCPSSCLPSQINIVGLPLSAALHCARRRDALLASRPRAMSSAGVPAREVDGVVPYACQGWRMPTGRDPGDLPQGTLRTLILKSLLLGRPYVDPAPPPGYPVLAEPPAVAT